MHTEFTLVRSLRVPILWALACVANHAYADATAVPTETPTSTHQASGDASRIPTGAGQTPGHCADTDTTSSSAPSAPGGVVNINTASADELERLPGIGPSRAQAILALRARLTRFTRLEELLRVKGIGRATFRKLRPLLTLQGATTLSDSPHSPHSPHNPQEHASQ